MFDFHLHTKVSYDSNSDPEDVVAAAIQAGLKEICFTDHLDYDPLDPDHMLRFDTRVYNEAYDSLESDQLVICRGMEFGMLEKNGDVLKKDLQRRHFDFVIGSAHFSDNLDPYFEPFWEGKTMEQAERCSLEQVLACVEHHDDFDVLGHLTYVSKAYANPTKRPVLYENYRELVDEIFRALIRKDKGIEINTSGKDPVGVFLPSVDYLRRFKELGGKIVTVGSDAHDTRRVGQYCHEACRMVGDIFGYVCTFRDRKPVFHKL